MKREKKIFGLVLFALVTAVSCVPAWSQGYTGGFKGKVTNNYEPEKNVQVVFSYGDTGKQYRTKTDKTGEYLVAGMQMGPYTLELKDSKGKVLYTRPGLNVGSNEIQELPDIEITHPETSGGMAGSPQTRKMTKEEIARIKAENAKLMGLNTQITQAQTAMQQQNWAEAETALKQILAAIPDTKRWEFYKALADTQKNQNKNDDAVQNYEKGIQIAQEVASGAIPPDPNNPNSQPARAKAGAGQMLNSEGNLYVTMGKNDQAMVAFRKAAELDPNPAVAYYNLCAMEFNAAKYDDAATACDKSIAADPNKADSWFFKGAALVKAGKAPAAAEALNKYLQLAPTGPHAAEAKAMLAKK